MRILHAERVSFCRDHKKMLKNEDLDAVYVTTPIICHVPIVVAHANRDLSIFVEKPLADSRIDARKDCDVAATLRGVHMVGFQKRFSDIFRNAKQPIHRMRNVSK